MHVLFVDAAGYFMFGAGILGASYAQNAHAEPGYFANAIAVILLGIALFVLLRQMLVVTVLNVLGIGLFIIEEFRIGYILQDGSLLHWVFLFCVLVFWVLTLFSVREHIADARRTNQLIGSQTP